MVDRIGQQFGSYRLVRLLGRGGFAEVYLGEHIHLATQAAIKVLHTQLIASDLQQFMQEARTLVSLNHPRIIHVLDCAIEGDVPYIVMNYAANGTLRQRHPKGTPVPLATIAPYIVQIASALQYAHNNRLIHRDVKPENMLIGNNGEVMISDFGIAVISSTSTSQGTKDAAGTANYMSPEQIMGKPVAASDQYALGIVTYEWLRGDYPFHGSFLELCTQHMFAPPPSLRQNDPTLPIEVENAVMKALAKESAQRFSSIEDFASIFKPYLPTHFNQQNFPYSMAPLDHLSQFTEGAIPTQLQLSNSATDMSPLPLKTPITPSSPSLPPQNRTFPTQPSQPAMSKPSSPSNPAVPIISNRPQSSPSYARPSSPQHSRYSGASSETTQNIRPQRLPPTSTTPYPRRRSKAATISIIVAILLVLAVTIMLVSAHSSGTNTGSISFDTGSSQPSDTTGTNQLNGTNTSIPMTQTAAGQIAAAATQTATAQNAAQAQATQTAEAQTQATQTATTQNAAQAQATQTAEAQTQATQTAIAQSAATSPQSIYAQSTSGTPTLDDPLSNQDSNNWDEVNGTEHGCSFTGGVYDITIQQAGFVQPCFANSTDFANFAFQVTMTIVSGDGGGLIFRTNDQNTYRFRVGSDGSYDLVVGPLTTNPVRLINAGSQSIGVSLNQPIVITVIAIDGDIYLYVDDNYLAKTNNSISLDGKIGLFTVDFNNASETTFSNAKVWSL